MNAIEGKITIEIFPESTDDSRVYISSTRPLELSKMFIGKSPEQVLMVIPMMFNICGTAHSYAALSAIQQNMNITTNPKLAIAHELLLQIEIAREHLMRIFLDWPKLLTLNQDKAILMEVNSLTDHFTHSLFGTQKPFNFNAPEISFDKVGKLVQNLENFLQKNVFSIPCQSWLDNKDIVNWATTTDTLVANTLELIGSIQPYSPGSVQILHLPELNNELLLEQFDAADADRFIGQPDWLGKNYETTSLSRQHKHPLLRSLLNNSTNDLQLRWVARLAELAGIPQKMHELLMHIKQENFAHYENQQHNTGLSQIETARGRLIHRVNVDQDLISQYQILAPTEWNFHPKGIVAKSLSKLSTGNKKDLSKLAHLIINTIDPCVGYELNIH